MKDELLTVKKELRFIEAYALLATLFFAVLWFQGFIQSSRKQHFEEIVFYPWEGFG